jgi:hypothetical protein
MPLLLGLNQSGLWRAVGQCVDFLAEDDIELVGMTVLKNEQSATTRFLSLAVLLTLD